MSDDIRADFSLERAVATIDRATAYDAPLRQRTEGVTWAVWGVVTAFAILLSRAVGEFLPWQWSALVFFVAWPVVGISATSAIWRIASLSAPALAPAPRRVVLATGLAIVAIAVVGQILWLIWEETGAAPQMVLFVALAWTLLMAAQWGRMTREGRRVGVVLGGGMAVAAGAAGFLLDAPGEQVAGLVAVAIAGGVPFVAGLARSLRA